MHELVNQTKSRTTESGVDSTRNRNLVRSIAIAVALVAAPATLVGEREADADMTAVVVVNADFPTFHAALSPYGTWVELDAGPVWVPDRAVVGAHFRPYDSGGGWVYTDDGWYFETSWDWGSIPFHYGRWMFLPAYGWVWVADYDWAPAWVDWSYGGGYVGWAPLPPVGVVVEISSPHWYFVEERHFAAPRVATHVLPVKRARYAATVAVPMRTAHVSGTWYAGPTAKAVSRASGRAIHKARISPPARGADYRVKLDRSGPGMAPSRKPDAKGLAPRTPALDRPGKPTPSRVAPGPAPSHKTTSPAPLRMPPPKRSHVAPAPAPWHKATSPAPVDPTPPPKRSHVAPRPAPSHKTTAPAPVGPTPPSKRSHVAPRPAPAPKAPVAPRVDRTPPPVRAVAPRPAEHAPRPASSPGSKAPRPPPARPAPTPKPARPGK